MRLFQLPSVSKSFTSARDPRGLSFCPGSMDESSSRLGCSCCVRVVSASPSPARHSMGVATRDDGGEVHGEMGLLG